MRLFIAIPMPESVREEINNLQQPIEGVRWEQKNKFHLTLKFLGDTEPAEFEDLRSALDQINIPAFSITVDGVGYFPKGGPPRVIWAGINKNRPLQELHRTLEELCTELGFEPEQRSFKPHVTIGRTKDASQEEVRDFIEQHQGFNIENIPVKKVVLYESKLHPDGARHIPQKEINLDSR